MTNPRLISNATTPHGAWLRFWDSFVPASYFSDIEQLRRARLQIRFGGLGFVFGMTFASFYLAISHWWGAGIIMGCSLLFAQVPWLVKQTRNLQFTGHLFALVLLLGFSTLCSVEGGLHGHAVAWLAAVPLCVLLLLDLRGALWWSAGCFVVALTFGVLEAVGVKFPETYPKEWDTIICLAGYAGLVPFMALLGVIFERTRSRAFKQLESAMAALSMANQNLRRLNEEKDEFLNIAAHDLKSPLTGVMGYAELLAHYKTPTPAQIQTASHMIQSASQRMLDIISDLLDIQKIEDGTMRMELAQFAVRPLVENMVGQYEQRAAQKQMLLELELPPAALQVTANAAAMEQILDNLLSNAIKYSPPGTTVKCVCTFEEGLARFEIHDQGPGLSKEDLKNLFKKFCKLTPQPTGGENSNGLGLWIVQRMAQGMGGDVYCRSTLGEGSVFGLALRGCVPEAGEEVAEGADTMPACVLPACVA